MVEEPILAANEIQGNVLRGFNTQHLTLLGLQFARGSASANARGWIARLPIAALIEVAGFRMSRRTMRAAGVVAPDVLINIAFSARGCTALGLPLAGIRDKTFLRSMGDLSREFGDVRMEADPLGHYLYGRTQADTPDVVLILGSDDFERIAVVSSGLEQEAITHGLEHLFREDGAKLPGDKEHFGFRDGISQGAPRGRLSDAPDDFLVPRVVVGPEREKFAAPGKPLVWPGQFVFGYRDQLTDDAPSSSPAHAGEAWMDNGSYLIFRRLRQDVAGFRRWCVEQASAMSHQTGLEINANALAARVVGRWPEGTPFGLSPDGEDLALTSDPNRINHFNFRVPAPAMTIVETGGAQRIIPGSTADPQGRIGPRCAHIRKVNPRDLAHDKDSTLRLQLLRRGIPYGPSYQDDEDDSVDRGLLFLAYQTSFDGQIVALSRDWMNHPDRPETSGGHDLLVGQGGTEDRFGILPTTPGGSSFRAQALEHFVTATGGALLFSPAISVVRGLVNTT